PRFFSTPPPPTPLSPLSLHDALPISLLVLEVEQARQRGRLRLGIVGEQVQLGEPQVAGLREQLLDPVARRMQLEPVADAGRDEGPPAAVLLDPQLPPLRLRDRGEELLLVERETEMVHAWQRPLPRLDDDVDGAALELRQPELEAQAVELLPRRPLLERGRLLADPAV